MIYSFFCCGACRSIRVISIQLTGDSCYLEDIGALELGLDLAPRFATRYQGPLHEISSVYSTHEVSRSSIATPLYGRSADNDTPYIVT